MNIVLLGAQGSGKGAISEYLVKKHNFNHISTGELFREEIKNNSKIGEKLASHVNKGLLVPDEMVFDILQKAISKQSNNIFDGFPRNMLQAQKLESILNIDKVLFVDVPKNILMERLSARRFCPMCKENYNLLYYKESLCSKCKQVLQQRNDDVPEAINKRLEIFYENIEPLLNFYTNKGILERVDNSGELDKTYSILDEIMK